MSFVRAATASAVLQRRIEIVIALYKPKPLVPLDGLATLEIHCRLGSSDEGFFIGKQDTTVASLPEGFRRELSGQIRRGKEILLWREKRLARLKFEATLTRRGPTPEPWWPEAACTQLCRITAAMAACLSLYDAETAPYKENDPQFSLIKFGRTADGQWLLLSGEYKNELHPTLEACIDAALERALAEAHAILDGHTPAIEALRDALAEAESCLAT